MDAPPPPPLPLPLKKGEDYYIEPGGRWVFTAKFLLARGTCCRSGCRHCPYGFDPSAAAAPGERVRL